MVVGSIYGLIFCFGKSCDEVQDVIWIFLCYWFLGVH